MAASERIELERRVAVRDCFFAAARANSSGVEQPVNQPFIDIAMRLSKLPVHELREVGENILNITF